MKNLFVLLLAGMLFSGSGTATAQADAKPEERRIVVDVSRAGKPIDRFFDHSVGADYPGTLIRDDSQA